MPENMDSEISNRLRRMNLDKYLNNITVGECSELMAGLPDRCIDLTVTSPPYGNLRIYEQFDFRFEDIAYELWRVTKDGGVVVWVVGDQTYNGSESGESFRQALHFKELGFLLHDTMIYQKAGSSAPSGDRYYQSFEYMFVLSRGKPKTFNPIKDRENKWHGKKFSKIRSRRQKDGTLKDTDWDASEGKKYGVRFNIWRYAVGYKNHGDPICHEHPAPFPERLARDHIISWSKEGDIILDPMCGSGTTCVMALQNNRRYIGFDISEKYVELSRRRLYTVQTRLL